MAMDAAPPRRLFQAPPTTKELEERNYYQVPSDQTDTCARLIPNNQFWAEYARFVAARNGSDEKAAVKPFLSQFVAYAASNFTEIVMALAVVCCLALALRRRCYCLCCLCCVCVDVCSLILMLFCSFFLVARTA
jgi:hypothetical protein